jgi:mRNA-degrading endonuclease RelE of RelBE toxin-antitoxin system
VGDYRIVYAVEDERLLVFVVKVGHRREVYRQEQSLSDQYLYRRSINE